MTHLSMPPGSLVVILFHKFGKSVELLESYFFKNYLYFFFHISSTDSLKGRTNTHVYTKINCLHRNYAHTGNWKDNSDVPEDTAGTADIRSQLSSRCYNSIIDFRIAVSVSI